MWNTLLERYIIWISKGPWRVAFHLLTLGVPLVIIFMIWPPFAKKWDGIVDRLILNR
jgi:hypothetical protein